jgi:hypothetical protein
MPNCSLGTPGVQAFRARDHEGAKGLQAMHLGEGTEGARDHFVFHDPSRLC